MYNNIYCIENLGAESDCRFGSYTPEPSDLPWTVALLLGTHSRKHVFENTHKLQLKVVGRSLQLFDRRLRWQWLFRHVSTSTYTKPLVRSEVRHCRDLVDPCIAAFGMAVKRTVIEHIKKANMTRYTLPSFIGDALRWLKKNNMTCQLSDKDGVFVVISHKTFQVFQAMELKKRCYRPTSALSLDVLHREASKRYITLASMLRNLGYLSWSRECFSWLAKSESPRSLLCKWNCTVKTHKPDGEVVARSLHSSVGHMFSALSEVLNRLIGPVLRKYQHLCSNSEEAQSIFAATAVCASTVLLKFDIKEFYLSGSHNDLAAAVCSLFSGEEALFVRHLVAFLLQYQFVEFDLDTHMQVVQGSGMGMRHSGSISNAAFLADFELPLLRDRDRCGIQAYCRFQDDIVAAVKSPQHCVPLTEMLVEKSSSMYRVEKETFSLVGVPFLDLFVFKASEHGAPHRLAWRPYVKPTARHVPLSSASCHPMSCHRSWPRAEIQRMFSRASFRADFECAKQQKLSRWRSFFLSPSVVASAAAWQPKILLRSCSVIDRPVVRIVRLVLPYSERWRGINSKLQALLRLWSAHLREGGFELRIGVTFARGARPLWQLVRARVAPDMHVFSSVVLR
jgi:hypothetical protein